MRYICDGHEYRVCLSSPDVWVILNNYGSKVAGFSLDSQGYYFTAPFSDPQHSTSAHRSTIDSPEQWAVQQYVAWAIDNDTVEGH